MSKLNKKQIFNLLVINKTVIVMKTNISQYKESCPENVKYETIILEYVNNSRQIIKTSVKLNNDKKR